MSSESGKSTLLSEAADKGRRWGARPWRARAIRTLAFLLPILGSIVFVHLASRVFPAPAANFWLFVSWWIGISVAATLVLALIDRGTRRLLPLAALFQLSLVFPDQAPSRFRIALRAGTVDSLEREVERAKALGKNATPNQAAEQLLGLVAALDAHDSLTHGHSNRVRAYSQMIGKELRLSADDVDKLNWAALLHDVGKLEIPSDILLKQSKPTDEEFALLRKHPELGERLTAPLREWLGEWAGAISEHHERWDGKGYPRGLAGEDIGLSGRIVAVADVFDVITSSRAYKEAGNPEEGREEIARCAGTQFDPRIVRTFLSLSLGRMRLVMGPLSWLAQAPILARVPVTPALSTVASAAIAVGVSLGSGTVAITAPASQPAAGIAQSAPQNPPTAPARPTAPSPNETVLEDSTLRVRLDGITRETASRLKVTTPPGAGEATATGDFALLYRPPADFNGKTSIGYETCWKSGVCASGLVNITVTPVNDAPGAQDDIVTVRQGQTALIDVLANDTDRDDDDLEVAAVADTNTGTASIQGRRVSWTPPEDFTGSTSFGYSVSDGNGGDADARVLATVLPPNQAPTALSDTISTFEDTAVSIPVLANDRDPDGGALSLVSVARPTEGTATVDGDQVTYVPPPDFSGTASFIYSATDSGGTTVQGSAEVTVLAVNDPPAFVAGANVTVREDAAAQTVSDWVAAMDSGATDEAGQQVSFSTNVDEPTLFKTNGRPKVADDGTLSFTPADDANGKATVTVRAIDDGGTSNGGVARSAPQTLTITIQAVNDAPTFTAGADESVLEDAGAQAVSGWASAISAGPTNEDSQATSFTVTNDANSLFSVRPSVNAAGRLTYTPAADANGTATITVRALDDGGSSNGGISQSAPRTATITIGAVNDPPAFSAGADLSVAEDTGAQTVAGWVSAISPGPTDESGQTTSFSVTNNANALFSVQPSLSPAGTLTYTPAANANGTATITVRATDSGGTANGGQDASSTLTRTITLTPVNDGPAATADGFSPNEDQVAFTFNVLTNDTDPDGDTLSVSAFNAAGIANGTLTDNGGGSFSYTPDDDWNGVESFTYDVSDGNGGTDTATATLTVVAVPDAPEAADDAYTTNQNTPLPVAAPGVATNDGDGDGDPINVQTALVAGPSNGGVTLNADGSFTYTPNLGFSGSDSFTYRVDDGTGLTDDAVVDITVTAVPAGPLSLYMQPSGSSADDWSLATTPAPAAAPVPDHDSSGDPGLRIKESDGDESNSDPAEWQTWTYPFPATTVLNGPVTLQLWSTSSSFWPNSRGHPYLYLYECDGAGANCTKIAENDIHVHSWNGFVPNWVYRELTVGSVSRTITAGRTLQLRMLYKHDDLRVALTAAYPSALEITTE